MNQIKKPVESITNRLSQAEEKKIKEILLSNNNNKNPAKKQQAHIQELWDMTERPNLKIQRTEELKYQRHRKIAQVWKKKCTSTHKRHLEL